MSLIILANREPLRQSETGDWYPAVGGLSTALLPVLNKTGGVWIAWGEKNAAALPRLAYPKENSTFEVHRLYLSEEEVSGYYYGLSNRVLWPICHYFIEEIHLDRSFFSAYETVNRKFAEAAAKVYKSGDTIWVHDYHLMLTPELLRERFPEARIGYFFHIPWPAEEVWRILPWSETFVRGLMGADLIGFHTAEYAENFLEAAAQLPDADRVGKKLRYRGRDIRVESHPIGIDTAQFQRFITDAVVRDEAEKLRHDVHSEFILLGIDRLDYTKGVPERLQAFEWFLKHNPEYRGRVTLFQISAPSRTRIDSYQRLKRSVDEIAGRINGSFMQGDWVPVRYLYHNYTQSELASFYLAADVALVTPLRDGMNLVAQEFAAVTSKGVLMLSSLAGAAAVLPGAVIVNPFDIEGVARALKGTLTLPEIDRGARAQRLKEHVEQLDVHRWALQFLSSLENA
jgi:trehalose 6-phosphate synthase/phosphatase